MSSSSRKIEVDRSVMATLTERAAGLGVTTQRYMALLLADPERAEGLVLAALRQDVDARLEQRRKARESAKRSGGAPAEARRPASVGAQGSAP